MLSLASRQHYFQTRPDLFNTSLLTTTYSLHNYHVMGSRLLSRSFQVEKWEGEGGDEEQAAVDGNHEGSLVVAEPPSDGMAVDSNEDV